MSTCRQAIRARRKASKDKRYTGAKVRTRVFRGHMAAAKKKA